MLTRRTLALGFAASALATRSALADTYPVRPIKMIAPFTPGSPVDVVARLLAQQLSTALPQSVVVENRPGAGTIIGMKATTTAAPDGYTLLFQSSSLVVAPAMYKNLDFDPLKSFAPVANVAWGSWVTVVPPDLPVRNARELIDYAKANPDKLAFGFGQGTAPQLVGEWFNKTNGLKIASVPYKGGMQAVTDMMTGSIQVNIGTTATLLPLIREGKIRAIAQWGPSREPELPEVPTMIESGFPGLSLGFWAGLWAPAGTPQAVIDTLNASTNRALDMPETREAMRRLGVAPRIGSPKDFADFIAAEAPKWQRIVEASGVQIN
ncbi:Bug family tripartite tricarboxylate transporter substrate binding protein [Rhodoplanes sp. Z2-YC6860]|uniref:Bug family tripartite tricarboxylate transporter substrate binding protein n=1 Tax=Rhodoplanes sp. Z2-YC6860 TaxID=674703 RepID=UPI00078D7F98|nr:tripartite tricarboxylate transporter substrate binding protein [Rhodoplanes sp. Z2-YC6860]AMN43364.1 extra-cytoplasmic solute receptor [Rhodoplanes sp. Z2-YC6860]